MLVVGCISKFFPNLQKDFGILACCSIWTSHFSQFMKNIKIWVFEYKPRLHFQIFPNSLKIQEIGIFQVPLLSYLVRLQKYSLEYIIFVKERERGPNLLINYQFSKKDVLMQITILGQFKCFKYSHLPKKICFICFIEST